MDINTVLRQAIDKLSSAAAILRDDQVQTHAPDARPRVIVHLEREFGSLKDAVEEILENHTG